MFVIDPQTDVETWALFEMIPLPDVGEKILVDVSTATIDLQSFYHVGKVIERWRTRCGEVQAIVEVLGSTWDLSFEFDPRSRLTGGAFLTGPYRGPVDSPFDAFGPADQHTHSLIEWHNDDLLQLDYLDEMDRLFKAAP